MSERLTREEEDAIACMSAAALDGNGAWARTALDRLRAELDAVRAERDEARAQIGDVRASISAHKIRVATDERDAAIDRAERAEAALAALHAAWANVLHRQVKSAHGAGGYEQRSLWDLRDAFADTAAAAEAYKRRVRAEGEDAARQTALDALRAWRADGNRNAPIYGPATHILDALRVDTFYEKLLKRSATTRTDDEAPARGDRAR